MDDLISRQSVLNLAKEIVVPVKDGHFYRHRCIDPSDVRELPSAQPERLTDDDFETIRIHLSAYKEKLCNQNRWEEADEYQRIIDRFMAFASAQPTSSVLEQVDLIDRQAKDLPSAGPEIIDIAKTTMAMAKTADMVAVVRCKDCKYWCINKRLDIPWCRNSHIDRGANDFCSYAERRTDETD